jgi:hypothetical protein
VRDLGEVKSLFWGRGLPFSAHQLSSNKTKSEIAVLLSLFGRFLVPRAAQPSSNLHYFRNLTDQNL